MITCTVHEREGDEGPVEARAERIVFVKEGFAWLAFFLPLLWLLYHRLWIAFAAFTAAFVALGFLAALTDWPEWAEALISFGLSLLAALEGNNLRRWALARRGYAQVDVAVGRDREECERRFFDGWLETQDRRAARPGSAAPAAARRAAAPASQGREGGEDVIGLFPEPNR